MWLAWFAGSASAALIGVLPRDVAIVPLIATIGLYVKVVSEMKLQIRLRGRDDPFMRKAVWYIAGVLVPLVWPLWRRANRVIAS